MGTADSKDVLVIGYGKIGKIKAGLWRSLGRTVWVYDIEPTRRKQAEVDGFGLHEDSRSYEDLIADVSTPALYHVQSLEWLLKHVITLPRNVLVEKPLVSDDAELKELELLLATSQANSLAQRIIVNESYYLSTALRFIADDLKRQSSRIVSINAEMSKNRLDDVRRGRFVDGRLGSLGIELPHMIAMIQSLGCDLSRAAVSHVAEYETDNTTHNEGFAASIAIGNVPVMLESYLGDFRFEDGHIRSNESIRRTLEVKTDSCTYSVVFDPVIGLGRYKAEVTVLDHTTGLIKRTVLDDNHLLAQLKKIHANDADGAVDSLLKIDNSIAISRLIFKLKSAARRQHVSTTDDEQERSALTNMQPAMERYAHEYN